MMLNLNDIKNIKVLENEPLKNHCTFKIGGTAKLVVIPATFEALRNVLAFADTYQKDYVVVGKGSNILYPDEGFEKLVIKIDANAKFLNYVKFANFMGRDLVEAGAGTPKDKLLDFAIKHEIKGFDFLAGIPGTVGGGVRMNAGTSDGKFENIVKSFITINSKGEKKEYRNVLSLFSYRRLNIPSDEIILSIAFHTTKGDIHDIKKRVEDIKDLRKSKHPLDYPNCGSVFKNPPHIPAGLLIEKNNLKGYTVGDAQVSKKHGNFIVNLGGAKSCDVKAIIEHVKKVIFENEKILLKEEVIILED